MLSEKNYLSILENGDPYYFSYTSLMEKQINISKYVSHIIMNLKKDKLYDYSVFKNIPEDKRVAFRKAISRIADKGVIVKVGSKKFYRRGYRESFVSKNPLRIKAQPFDRRDLRRKGISAQYLKSRLSANLFWSNPNGMIPKERIIYKILDNQSLSDLDFARFNFGDEKVIEIFMENFDINEKPMMRDILNV